MNTGLLLPAFCMFLMMRPGMAPIYVRLCPRISDSSCRPPNDMRTYFLPMALAMLLPRLVLPTPGGPYRQRIGLFMSPRSDLTAKCSNMRSFTFSMP